MSIKKTVRDILPAPMRVYPRKTLRLLKRAGRLVDRRTLSRAEFIDELNKLGITEGASVHLHTSMDELGRRVPSVSPAALVRLLKELVGREGNLLVPTFPFSGSQYHYARTHRFFDVKRTLSEVGLFTELFRRSEGVTRSLHPTHPIAAWGRNSREIVAEHHLGTAFGEKCPVYKMQEYGGLVAGVGVTPWRCFTVFHMAEELHPLTFASQYSDERFPMTIVNGKERIEYSVRPLKPGGHQYQAGPILHRKGILKFYRVKGLRLASTRIDEFLEGARELIEANLFHAT